MNVLNSFDKKNERKNRSKLFPRRDEVHLISLDLDGTALETKDYKTLNEQIRKIVRKLTKKGHVICIATGRNYLSALPYYQEMELNTFLVTYNGAYIVNPSKKKSPILINSLSNEIVKQICNERVIKHYSANILIDTTDMVTIATSDEAHYREVFFHGNPYVKTNDLLNVLGESDVLQLVIELPNEEKIINEVIMVLRDGYAQTASFYISKKLKAERPEDKALTVVDSSAVIILIRSSNASKGIAAEWIASYYNISLINSMAFGNTHNDAEIMNIVGVPVVTADAPAYLKACARGITDLNMTNSEGVAAYLAQYFGYKI